MSKQKHEKKTFKDQIREKAPKLGLSAEEPLPPVTAPTNTSRQDPVVHLFGMLAGGTSGYIEGQERQGQTQLAGSTSIPSRLMSCTEDQLRALGFELGPKPTGRDADDLFRPALLPKGWKKVPTEHSMWTDIVDEKGFPRGSIFYKAAFYDRSAHMGLSIRLRSVDDYEARDRDGTIACNIEAAMPGRTPNGDRNAKVIHRIEHETKFADHRDARGPDHPFFLACDATRERAKVWLQENFPKYADPAAYWDLDL